MILQPDFVCLQGLLLERGRSSMGICVNATFGADLEAAGARNSTLTNPKSEGAHIGRLSRHLVTSLPSTSDCGDMRSLSFAAILLPDSQQTSLWFMTRL
jgi:hypothetical protein